MGKAVISKRVLDKLIRTAISNAGDCSGVEPMPVTWRPPPPGGSNWMVPGWTGDADSVQVCRERLDAYLQLLGARFDIPDER